MNYRDEWKKQTAENPSWLFEWISDHYFRNIFFGVSLFFGIFIVLYGSVAALGVNLGACLDAYSFRGEMNDADVIYDAIHGLGPGIQQICSFLPDAGMILFYLLLPGTIILMLRKRLRSRI